MGNWEVYKLQGFYNNKGVSWVDKGIFASINHINESYAGELLPNNEIFYYSGIPFEFPKTDSLDFDMLSFAEQRIDLPEGNYTKVAFLGFSTWGDYHDSIFVSYSDGFTQEIPFGFNDWQEFHSHNREDASKLVMNYYRLKEEQMNRKVKLELRIIEVDSNRNLKSLVLPDNDYSYILSISLLKI